LKATKVRRGRTNAYKLTLKQRDVEDAKLVSLLSGIAKQRK
jgi:hypothetical protein